MALDRETEVRHLAQADIHVADAERQVTTQMLVVEKLRAGGRDMVEAERLLASLQDILKTMGEHRTLILNTIRQIDDGLL